MITNPLVLRTSPFEERGKYFRLAIMSYNPGMALPTQEEYVEMVAQHAGAEIQRLLNNMDVKRRWPVDCVAFNAITADDSGKFFHSACVHPDRGRQFGCLLTGETPPEMVVRRLPGAVCEYRIKKGRKGATILGQRIEDEEIRF
jgi:hypothetical protein